MLAYLSMAWGADNRNASLASSPSGAASGPDAAAGSAAAAAPSASAPGGSPGPAGAAAAPLTSSQLRAGLGITGSAADWRAKVLGSVVELGGVVGAVGLSLRPNGPGVADRTAAERCANCATSLPYLLVGAHTFCARCSAAGKAWGASLGAVGTASLAFHSSAHGTGWRNTCRRMDYWTIALSSNLLARAAFPGLPWAITLASTALTPFHPFLVSAINSLATEVRFLRRSHAHPGIRRAQLIHSGAAALGVGLFFLEDARPEMPFLHSAWHLLSTVCVGTSNALLRDLEQGGLRRAAKPLSSLPPPTAAAAQEGVALEVYAMPGLHGRDWQPDQAIPPSKKSFSASRQLAPAAHDPC